MMNDFAEKLVAGVFQLIIIIGTCFILYFTGYMVYTECTKPPKEDKVEVLYINKNSSNEFYVVKCGEKGYIIYSNSDCVVPK